jgi:hypothetical protein
MTETPYRMAGQSKKMMAETLSLQQCKAVSKWWPEFATEPPARLTTALFRDKFEAMVQCLMCTETTPASPVMELDQFTRSPHVLNGKFTSEGCYVP